MYVNAFVMVHPSSDLSSKMSGKKACQGKATNESKAVIFMMVDAAELSRRYERPHIHTA